LPTRWWPPSTPETWLGCANSSQTIPAWQADRRAAPHGAETVKTHLARVYDKVDIHTRAGLAAAVAAQTTPPAGPSR
jgi:hypothetical protein